MKLKKYLYHLLLALTVLATMSSCLSSDDEEVISDEYCYISDFTIGNLKRTIYIKSTEGKDSAYTVSFNGSLYPMSIDQRNLLIENKDSLPFGTRVNAVLATISFSGGLAYRVKGDEEWTAYNSKDSIDFGSPLEFLVFSNGGNSERHYTVKLNVHKQDGDKFNWNKMEDTDELRNLNPRKLVAHNGKLYLLGKNAAGEVVCAARSAQIDDKWILCATTHTEKADVNTLQIGADGTLYMSTEEGVVLQSTNGASWDVLSSEAQEGCHLIGVSSTCLFALQQGVLKSSRDNGLSWQVETLDDDAKCLPNEQVSLIESVQSNGYTRLTLIGCKLASNDKKAEVWSKAWSVKGNEEEASWMYYPHTSDNKYLCPQMAPMFVLPYCDGLVAFGGKYADGQKEAMSGMLFSPDYGLTWNTSTNLTLPDELEGCDNPIAATVDEDNFLWIVTGEQTWRGRLNKLGFKK